MMMMMMIKTKEEHPGKDDNIRRVVTNYPTAS